MPTVSRTAVIRYVEMFAGLAAIDCRWALPERQSDSDCAAVPHRGFARLSLLGTALRRRAVDCGDGRVQLLLPTAALHVHHRRSAELDRLLAFLVTALVAGNLSERARREAEDAKRRRREVERLYALSQQLLTTESLVSLLNLLPKIITDTFTATGAALFVTDHAAVYRSDPDVAFDEEKLRSVAARGELVIEEVGPSYVSLRVGVKTVGALAVVGGNVSRQSLEAIGSLAGLAIERARAVDQVTIHRAAQESERLRTALLDSVTHEFRTPLTGIKASVSSLLTSSNLNDEQRTELLTIIDEETDRLNRLVGEASEMAQLDSGLVKLNLQPHNVRDAIDSALDAAHNLLQKHTVEVRIADGLPPVMMDVDRIREVVTHLLENAAKYSPAGTLITVTAERQGRYDVISVADQGPGIDSFEQSLIFEKFYRGRAQQYAAHGTGMGLAIAKVIVEAHGGTIGVVSQVGHGSVFSFKLPTRASAR